MVFTLAGFVNPERKELRKLGEKLGARYTGNITKELTHMITCNLHNFKVKKIKVIFFWSKLPFLIPVSQIKNFQKLKSSQNNFSKTLRIDKKSNLSVFINNFSMIDVYTKIYFKIYKFNHTLTHIHH